MFSKLIGFLPFNKIAFLIIIGLFTSLSITGALLIRSYRNNGELYSQVEQWKYANEHWSEAYEKLDKKLLDRQKQFNQLSELKNKRIIKIDEVQDETNCLDQPLPGDVRLQFITNSSQ